MGAPDVLAALAAGDPAAFVRNVLPVVREASCEPRRQATRTGAGRRLRDAPGPRGARITPMSCLPAARLSGRRRRWRPGDPAAVRDMAGSVLATEQFLRPPGSPPVTPACLATPPPGSGRPVRAGPGMVGRRARPVGGRPGPGVHAAPGQGRPVQERAAASPRVREEERGAVYGAAAWRLLQDVPRPNSPARPGPASRSSAASSHGPPRPAPHGRHGHLRAVPDRGRRGSA